MKNNLSKNDFFNSARYLLINKTIIFINQNDLRNKSRKTTTKKNERK